MKVLIAVDGSEPSRRAVDAIAHLASQMAGLQAVLVNVRSGAEVVGTLPAFDFEAIEVAQRRQQEELLHAELARARASGLGSATIWTAVGLPAQEIVRAAEHLQADQIAMGTHGLGAFGSLVLGSVAQRVVHLARMPVLLVR